MDLDYLDPNSSFTSFLFCGHMQVDLVFLSLSFLFCKVGMIELVSSGCTEDEMKITQPPALSVLNLE